MVVVVPGGPTGSFTADRVVMEAQARCHILRIGAHHRLSDDLNYLHELIRCGLASMYSPASGDCGLMMVYA